MLVLKSKHEKIIKDLQIKIDRLDRISNKRLKQIFRVEESLKTEININEKLRQELAECEKKLKDLEEKFEQSKRNRPLRHRLDASGCNSSPSIAPMPPAPIK